MGFPRSCNPGNIHHQVSRCQDVFERFALLFGEFRSIQFKSWPYRFAGIPSVPHEIQELFFLTFRLLGSNM